MYSKESWHGTHNEIKGCIEPLCNLRWIKSIQWAHEPKYILLTLCELLKVAEELIQLHIKIKSFKKHKYFSMYSALLHFSVVSVLQNPNWEIYDMDKEGSFAVYLNAKVLV